MVTDTRSNSWRRFGLIILFALVVHLAGTVFLPLVDRDEPRFAEATREMLERHDYLVPHFNNGYRFDKPILIYWCQAVFLSILGNGRWFGEFAVRLPSVLAAALTAGVLYRFGRRASRESVGIWAALIFTTSLQTIVHAKMAVADFVLILFMTLGAWAGWELIVDCDNPDAARGMRNRWWWLFYLSLAMAFLAKGPLAWLPYFVVLICLQKNPSGLSMIRPISGLLLMLTVVGLWGIPALLATDGEFFRIGIGRHVVQRSVGTLEGHGASHWLGYLAMLPFYFGTVFASFFPWSWYLPALIKSRREIVNRPRFETFLLTGILLTFGIFSLIRTKLPHYTLPCFPLLSLWMAAYLPVADGNHLPFRRTLVRMTAFALVVGWILIPWIAPLFPSERLYQQSESWLRPDMEFASLDYDEPSLVWCFRRKIHGWHHPVPPEGLAPFMAQPGPRFCILPTDQIPNVLHTLPTSWKTCRTAGLNLVHFKRVDLTLVLKPE